MYFCALSGEPPQDPVVVPKSGLLYERRLITKYIQENGTEPMTGDKLEESDLVALKTNPKAAAPRPPTATSVPALLHTLQNEWDAQLLETFALKQQYQATRQELSHALYQQDAATRVIARLIRERDASREALASVRASMGLAPDAGPDVEMADGAEAGTTGPTFEALPADILGSVNDISASLSAARKKRKPPAGWVKAPTIKKFTSTHTIPSLHSSSPAGITSIALSSTNTSHFLTGGNDKIVQLYDRTEGKVLASLKGHTKKVTAVSFREKEGHNTLLLSAGADKTARVWGLDEASGEYAPRATFKTHKGELTGLEVHPLSTFLALSSMDKTYSLQSLETLQTIFHSTASATQYVSLGLHPDATLLAMGTPSSGIHIYDIRAGELAGVLPETPTTSAYEVKSLSFSENGYHLVAPDSDSTVALWDLRKRETIKSIPIDGADASYRINKVRYDPSSQFVAVAGSSDLRIFAYKTWEELARFEEAGDVSDMVFGPLGQEIWGTSGREVRIWGVNE